MKTGRQRRTDVSEADMSATPTHGAPGAPEPQTGNQRPASSPASTVEQQRAAIDSGATGDKIPDPDPAAAPLGSDDEAARGPDPSGLAIARERSRPGE
jgi:hypothetical protein